MVTSVLASMGLTRENTLFPSLKALRAQGVEADSLTQTEWATSMVFAIALLAWIAASPRRPPQVRGTASALLRSLLVNGITAAEATLDLRDLLGRHGPLCTEGEDELHYCEHMRNLLQSHLHGLAPQEKLASFIVCLMEPVECESARQMAQEVIEKVSMVIDKRVQDGDFPVDMSLLHDLRAAGSSAKRLRVDGNFKPCIASGKVESKCAKSGAQVLRANGEDASSARKWEKVEVMQASTASLRGFEGSSCVFVCSDGSRIGDPLEGDKLLHCVQ